MMLTASPFCMRKFTLCRIGSVVSGPGSISETSSSEIIVSSVMRFIFFILLAVVGSASGAVAQEKTVPTVLIFGDSIVAGYGLKPEEILTVRLQSIMEQKGHHVSIINAGVSGDTTSGGRARLAWTLKKHHPAVVVLAIGGNDLLRGLPPALTRENLTAMLDELKAQKIKVILSAVQAPPSFGVAFAAEFNKIYPELAQKYDVPLYPFLLEKTFGQATLMQKDQIHPNAQGAELIAQALADYLIKNRLP